MFNMKRMKIAIKIQYGQQRKLSRMIIEKQQFSFAIRFALEIIPMSPRLLIPCYYCAFPTSRFFFNYHIKAE